MKMKKLLSIVVLLIAMTMLMTMTAFSLDEPEEPVAASKEEEPVAASKENVVKMSEPPPIDTIVQRYGRIVGKEGEGLVEGYRPTIVGKDFVVGGPHWLVPQVVYDVFMRGGNIWDAAVAGMWMNEVTGGQTTPGTAPFSMFVAKEGKAKAYCGLGTAPALGTVDYYIERFGDKILDPDTGYHFVPTMSSSSKANEYPHQDQWVRQLVAPSPDNMFALLSRYGTMSFEECMQEVYEIMVEGWPLPVNYVPTARRASFFSEPRLSEPTFQANRNLWRQLGPNPQPYDLIKEPGLARTLRGLINAERKALQLGATREEALQAARDWYYFGPIAKAIDKLNRENDGMIRYEDYANYEGLWYEQKDMPHTTFMGIDFYTDPTYTQAGVLVLVLNIIQNFDLVGLGWNTPEYIHVITQAFDLAFADRWQYFGDPLFHEMPENLWSKEYGTLRAGLIDMKKRFSEAPPAGDPANMKAVLEGWEPFVPSSAITGAGAAEPDLTNMIALGDGLESQDEYIADTIFFNIMDSEGNLFSYCPSDGRTNAAMVPGYGVSITRRGRQFTLGDWPHSIEPGKRPVSTPHTWLAVKDGEGYLTVQSPGGDSQIQCALPVMLNYVLWGMPPQVAIDQPRFETRNLYSMFTPYVANYKKYAGTTRVDPEMPEETIKGLEALGHIVQKGVRWEVGKRPVFIVREADTGLLQIGSSVYREHYHFGR